MTRRDTRAALDFLALAAQDPPADPPPRSARMTEPATLYYLRVDSPHGVLYKIGITQRTVLDRYTPSDLKQVTLLRSWRFKLGKWAKAKERQIILHGIADRYHGPDVLQAGGNSELFTADILGLDPRADLV